MKRYNPKDIEPKWQKTWADSKIYEASDTSDKPKKYILEYFPYPSGAAMHVGHVRNYTIGDAMARHYRMKGFNVLHPMGWDAFGLPAENYAIKTGISPQEAITQNTGRFKQQLTQMGFGFDWSREFASSDPDYYRWTQWFFLLLHKRGLAYQKESLQWWCPVDKTVLANEQVEAGKCWRCGSEVEKKSLNQWFFKITDYADRLSKDLDDVDWSDSIKSMQRNWIGRSKGAEIHFAIDGSDKKVEVFTTRPDTLYGATFMVLAPEHPLVKTITTDKHREHVGNYVKAAQAKTDVERQETDRKKTGVFTGSYAINPVNNEKLPIWIADYVLYGYGTGAIMAVPAHDERDYEFAKAFDLPIRQVIAERFTHDVNPHKEGVPLVPRNVVCMVVKHPTEDKILIAHPFGSDFWSPVMGGMDDGEKPEDTARRELLEETGYHDIKNITVFEEVIDSEFYAQHKQENRIAYITTVTVELASLDKKDVSEQEKATVESMWATPEQVTEKCIGAGADIIYRIARGEHRDMVHEGRLINSGPLSGMLTSDARESMVADLEAKGVGTERINYKIRDWLISRQRYWGAPIPMIHCPKDGIVPVPEDQLPVTLPPMESYEPSGDGRSPLARVEDWVNTTCPTCGGPAMRETDTMDGFACSSWYFLRFADPHNNQKAFDDAKVKYWLPVDDYIGGAEHAVMHLLYARMWTKVMQDEGLIAFGEPFKKLRNHGMILAPDGRKMSKSLGNVIAPDDLIDQGYGADAIRVMELFIGPWNQVANWSVEGMGGSFRFLQRVWALCQDYLAETEAAGDSKDDIELKRAVHRAIQKVSADMEDMGFNTAIAFQMQTVNELYRLKATIPFGAAPETWRWAIETLLLLLAPFVPHITEELWAQLGHQDSIHTAPWPSYDEQYLVSEVMAIAVQVNGKLRGQIEVASDADEAGVVAAAKADQKVQKYISDHEIRRVVYVPGRAVNFVV